MQDVSVLLSTSCFCSCSAARWPGPALMHLDLRGCSSEWVECTVGTGREWVLFLRRASLCTALHCTVLYCASAQRSTALRCADWWAFSGRRLARTHLSPSSCADEVAGVEKPGCVRKGAPPSLLVLSRCGAASTSFPPAKNGQCFPCPPPRIARFARTTPVGAAETGIVLDGALHKHP